MKLWTKLMLRLLIYLQNRNNFKNIDIKYLWCYIVIELWLNALEDSYYGLSALEPVSVLGTGFFFF